MVTVTTERTYEIRECANKMVAALEEANKVVSRQAPNIPRNPDLKVAVSDLYGMGYRAIHRAMVLAASVEPVADISEDIDNGVSMVTFLRTVEALVAGATEKTSTAIEALYTYNDSHNDPDATFGVGYELQNILAPLTEAQNEIDNIDCQLPEQER